MSDPKTRVMQQSAVSGNPFREHPMTGTLQADLAAACERHGIDAYTRRCGYHNDGCPVEKTKRCGYGFPCEYLVKTPLPIPDLLAGLEGWLKSGPMRYIEWTMAVVKELKLSKEHPLQFVVLALLNMTQEQRAQAALAAEKKEGEG